ncbi:hypothetical protein K435DRAFT_971871 [Dendrothele bispora CBS 962.96]|uniref:SnoaL-like domain-containing protein n=1 Tax=Dendrothele bispora (strain CBS 962.96) TaxID=1314807 RepID=A0A4S8L2H9_DENBC|nr:hypothetical protein K435DRAFT_971871 [Dendrothele bispora CBS 962.96]
MAAATEITPELITKLLMDPTIAAASVSSQLMAVLNFVRGVSNQDGEAIIKEVTDDLEYLWVPKGLEQYGPRVKNKEQTKEFFTKYGGGSYVKDFKFTVLDYVEMPGKIVLQMKSSGELTSGKGQYDNDYIWIFHIVQQESTSKIKVVKEFYDSLYCMQVWGSTET